MKRRTFLMSTGSATLGAACAVKSSPFDADVIVIGAGLSGLNAALILESIGYKVLVVEGRDRVGGRLFTLDEVPGRPEAGGNEIGSTYGRLLSAMVRHDVSRVNMRARTEGIKDHTCLNLGGETILLQDWPGHIRNPFPDDLKTALPWQFEFAVLDPYNPLTSPEQFLSSKYVQHDISVYQFLRSKGFSDEAIRIGAGTNLGHGNSPKDISLLMWFNILAFIKSSNSNARSSGSVAGEGGNQRIPEAMAEALAGDIHLSSPVVAIGSDRDVATVTLMNGRSLKAKRLIVTSPFSALRHVDIDAPVTTKQVTAIQSLDYTRSTQLHYRPTRKFWESDGLPPSMWTDSLSARFLALRNNPSDPSEITSFVVYANDEMALKLDQLGYEAANAKILSTLGKLRPSTKGALEFVKFHSWQMDPYAGGAYAAWKPRQITQFGKGMADPAGRIHFAGAHTSLVTRGMEAAMESGERAAFEVANLI